MIKHWDLTPGETVTLRRGAGDGPDDARGGVSARYRFRTTLVAVFEAGADKDLITLELMDDGTFRDGAGKTFHVVGRDRKLRMQAEEPLGEGDRFTRQPETLRRAAKGGA